MKLRNRHSRRRGQGLVEYALLVGGVALICAAAVSILGHKTDDIIAAVATIIPGAHADDNAPIASGKLIDTSNATGNGNSIDLTAITNENGNDRVADAIGGDGTLTDGFGGLVNEKPH